MLVTIIEYVVLIVFSVLLISLAHSSWSIAPWVPIYKKDLVRINQLAALRSGQTFVDLGCGDARVCLYIAKENPQVKVIGVELSLPLFFWAKVRELFSSPKNMTVKFGNALKTDLSNADVIYTFAVYRTINGELKEKFVKELKRDAKVLSYRFDIKDWAGKELRDKPNKNSQAIFVYQL